MVAQSSEYRLGPELAAIIIDQYEGGFDEYGCYSGPGKARFRSGNSYNGEFRRGVMDGRGRYTWLSDGTTYEGDVRNNELMGHGRYTWSDGSSYEGGVVKGLRNGYGTFTSADGTLVYEGDWQHSKRHGHGEQRYGIGTAGISSYVGDWQENCRHGRGTMTYSSGNVYEGDWVEDRKEGNGVMRWFERRERYTGSWKNDLQCGYGEHVWLEARPTSPASMDTQKQMCNVYRGEWLDGMRHGQGTFMYADGSRYTGQWRKNKKHGPAVFVSDNGRTFEGQFDHDVMLGKIGQDDDHPEMSAAVKLKIADILSSGNEDSRAAAVRDVERSVLQIISDLKQLYKRYARPGATAPRDSTMFAMSMEQFVVFARDCRALAPSTPVTVGEVYRLFFRMRRQHAFELNRSLERAVMGKEPCSKGDDGSCEGGDGRGLVGREDMGRGRRRGDSINVGHVEHAPTSLPIGPTGPETEGGMMDFNVPSREKIYDSRRAVTFREYVEGIVRLARIANVLTGAAVGDIDATQYFPHGGSGSTGSTAAAAGRLSTTPRTPALARIGAAPIEGGGSLSLPSGGWSTVSNSIHANDRGTRAAGGTGGDQREATQGRGLQRVNGAFKQFVATHLAGLLADLSVQDAAGGAAESGWRAGSRDGGRGGGIGTRGARGGGWAGAPRRGGGGSATGSKRVEEDVGHAGSACAKELSEVEKQISTLYQNYSGPSFAPMTLRSLLRMLLRDADLKRRAGLKSEDVKQVFKQANAFLQSRDGPADPENVGLTRPKSDTVIGLSESTESGVGDIPRPAAGEVAGAELVEVGGGGLPLPAVDSATRGLAGTARSTVDLDLLDQELMPDDFKVVMTSLFELARAKNVPRPSVSAANAASGVTSGKSSAPQEKEGRKGAGEEQEPVQQSVSDTTVAAQAVVTKETTNSRSLSRDDGDCIKVEEAGEGREGGSLVEATVGVATPDWLVDLKVFVLRVLQWADEGSAKRSKVVRAKPPTRVFPF